MPTLTIKTTWVEQLKALGVYDQWLFNVKNRNHNKKWTSRDSECISESNSFKEFLGRSFVFTETPEGYEFWYAIHRKY